MMVNSLGSFKIVIIAVIGLTLLLGLGANFALASSPNSGYVQYKVTVSGLGNSVIPFSLPISTTINETAQPS